MAANLRDPGSIPGGDLKRFQDSSNYVFHIVGECFSSAAGTVIALSERSKNAQRLYFTILYYIISFYTILYFTLGQW